MTSDNNASISKLDIHLIKLDNAYRQLYIGLILDSDVIYLKNNLPWYSYYYKKYSKYLNYWDLIDEILKLQSLLILQKSFNNIIKKQIQNTLLNGYIQFASTFWVEELLWIKDSNYLIPNQDDLLLLYKDLCNEILSIRLWLNFINDNFLIYRNENPRGLEFLESYDGKSLKDLLEDYRNIVFNDDNKLNDIILEEIGHINYNSFTDYYLEILKILLEYFIKYSNDYLLSLQ
ncbi:hypothetical protein RhiirA5_411578 [Rhizophagus irregularis]|uniref:Uncharacterized protein n=1 Tax=Rhizophagus irregularis TaxID=588596 RepID=A0A2N0Q0K9_9GLOM|nr:hypothetical protein RhiirA5_411578 [Rhizophagus irregularis]